MDWPAVLDSALTRADGWAVSLSVVIVMIGVAAGLKRVIESKFVRPPTNGGGNGKPGEDHSLERRMNWRMERIEQRLDRLSDDGNARDVAIARLEVKVGLDPILDRKDRR